MIKALAGLLLSVGSIALRSIPIRSPIRNVVWLVVFLCAAVFPAHVAPQQSQSPATFSVPAATPAQGYSLPPEKAAQAIAYARARHELYFADFAFSILVLVLIIRFRIAPKLRDWAERQSSRRLLQAIAFAAPLFCLVGLSDLPAGVVSHSLARRFNQSIQGWDSWLWDWLKGQTVSLVVAMLLVWLLYAVIRKSPRRWWLYLWLALLPIIVLAIFITPVFFEPLFFKFTPLAESHPQLTAELERVVVWDTTLARMDTSQILLVFGHEMGHYVLGHIRDGIVFTAIILLIALFAGFHLLHWAVRRCGSSLGLRSVGDWASLPMLLLILLLLDFVATPFDNAYSRHLEHQADQYGLEVVHGIVPDAPQVAARSFQVLGEIDLSEPAPSEAIKIWFYDHPTLDERILFAQTYDPWDKGQSPAFVK